MLYSRFKFEMLWSVQVLSCLAVVQLTVSHTFLQSVRRSLVLVTTSWNPKTGSIPMDRLRNDHSTNVASHSIIILNGTFALI